MASTCSVCNTPIANKYCSNCGQLFSKKKATIVSLFIDFFSNFFSVETSFIGTSKKLLSSPKFIIENFYLGNKRYYISPGSFILYAITIIAIHSVFYESNLWGIKFMLEGISFQYLLPIVFLPILMFCSTLTFIRQGFQLSKHIISNSYIGSLFLILSVIFDDIVITISYDLKSNLFLLLFLIFTFLWNSFVFSKKRKIWNHILNTFLQLFILIGLCYLAYLLFQSDSNALN